MIDIITKLKLMEYTKEQVKELIEVHNNLALTAEVIEEVYFDEGIDEAINMINKCVKELKEVVDKFAKPFQQLKEIS